jgi:hypothetical protein
MNILTIIKQIKFLISKSNYFVLLIQLFFVVSVLRLIQLEHNEYLRLVEILGLLITLITSVSKTYAMIFGTDVLTSDD